METKTPTEIDPALASNKTVSDVDTLSVTASSSYQDGSTSHHQQQQQPQHSQQPGSIVENPSGNQSVVSHSTHTTIGTQGTGPPTSLAPPPPQQPQSSSQQQQPQQHPAPPRRVDIPASPVRSVPSTTPSPSVNASPSSVQSSNRPPSSSRQQQQQQQQQPPSSQDVLHGMEPIPAYETPTAEDHERQNPFDNLHITYEMASGNNPQGRVHSFPHNVPSSYSSNAPSDDDELTEPSTSVNTGAETTHGSGGTNNRIPSVPGVGSGSTSGGASVSVEGSGGGGGGMGLNEGLDGAAGETSGYTRSDTGATSTFGRLIQSAATRTKGSMMTRTSTERKASNDEGDLVEGALIYGYLQKLGRNNKWQTRWFETDGECLTYYKSSKRAKLLATLDLAKVGSIVINHEDAKGCCFTINIAERPYHLRADSRAACKDWVIMLNRVKEARMEEGNVKIVSEPPDLLDDNFTPRVVVVANRQRTHAVEDEDLASWEAGGPGNANVDPATGGSGGGANATFPGKYAVTAPSSNRLARWQKPRNSLSKWANKVLAWARSLRKYGCTDAENDVILDHHLHPPGHDDVVKGGVANKTITTNPSATDSWSKSQNPVDRAMLQSRPYPPVNVTVTSGPFDTESMNPSTAAGSPTAADRAVDDEDETRELS